VTGAQFKRLLDNAAVTQRAAAQALEIHERTVRKFVAGDSVVPRTVELAAKYLWDKSRAS